MPINAAQSPSQIALKAKPQLEATGAFVVEPDGRVRMAPNRGGGYAPPWVWAPALTNDPQERRLLSTPSSDPSSPWRSSVPYSSGGPFTNRSTWDSETGTYEGGIDWGTLIGTAAVAGLFGAPALIPAGAATTSGIGAMGAGAAGAGAGASGVGAGTAAALTTAGATGAGMAGSSGAGWFSAANIIPSAVQGIASIFGANQQANASSEAAQLQYKATEEALADARQQRQYEQQQYANYLARLQPYLGLGTTAGSTLQNLLARSPYTKLANNGPLPQYATTPTPRPVGSGQTPAAAASGAPPTPDNQAPAPQSFMGGAGTITLRAPDGSVRQIPREQADHFQRLGAVPV